MQLTIRADDPDLHRRLKALAEARGVSLNTLVVELLADAVDMDARASRLRRYATWTQDDAAEFERHLADQRQVDPRDWR
jgi:predicted transcriptional regulator